MSEVLMKNENMDDALTQGKFLHFKLKYQTD